MPHTIAPDNSYISSWRHSIPTTRTNDNEQGIFASTDRPLTGRFSYLLQSRDLSFNSVIYSRDPFKSFNRLT